jgi:hypothetical protein
MNMGNILPVGLLNTMPTREEISPAQRGVGIDNAVREDVERRFMTMLEAHDRVRSNVLAVTNDPLNHTK